MAARPREEKEIDANTLSGYMAIEIKRQREAKGLTVQELSDLSGVSPRTILNWEQWDRHAINDDLAKLAKALGISVQALILDTECPGADQSGQQKTRKRKTKET